MDENTFWVKIWSMIIIGVVSIASLITTYWTIDRIYQGHNVIVPSQNVIQAK